MKKIKCLSVIGARPQFIKAAPVCRALASKGIADILVHTGQHYDDAMSGAFFRDLGIPDPSVNLGVGGGTHGAMTGRMLEGIEKVILEHEPNIVMVYGDTNSTLAGALAATKLHIPVIHIEAGLRSNNRRMPEEVNRVLTDHISDVLACTSEVGKSNLAQEGITVGVHVVGDVMRDVFEWASERAEARDCWPLDLDRELRNDRYAVMTLHRAENTDTEWRLRAIVEAVGRLPIRIVMPLHPRTEAAMARTGLHFGNNTLVIKPVGYLEMNALLASSAIVLTDSGGLQKEAYWARKPCLTLRDETEWTETVSSGWNRLVGADGDRIASEFKKSNGDLDWPLLYGDGKSADRIANLVAASV